MGAKFGLKASKGKWIIFLATPLLAVFSYYMIVQVARGGSIDLGAGALQLFFDLFYPLGSIALFTIVAIVFLLSKDYLGGKYKIPILILFFGFLVNYLADFTFSYTTTKETYFNGHFVDFIFLTAMFILSLAVNYLHPLKESDNA